MSYEISTPIFEGPLELLLHLIEKNELDITKVALAKVTDEFLAQVNVLREKMQIEVVADFLAVAARLLLDQVAGAAAQAARVGQAHAG